jgi:hypothetical protein
MKWRYSADYPRATAEVLRFFTDRGFQERKLAAIGGGEVLDFQFDGQHYRMRSRRRVTLQASAPGFIAKALGSGGMAVVYEDAWDVGSATGSVSFEFPGLPVQVGCSTRLTDRAGGCEMSFDWDIKAKVPVVGGQVEKLLVADLEIKLPAEVEAMRRLMAEAAA